jgi:hypothetical protein
MQRCLRMDVAQMCRWYQEISHTRCSFYWVNFVSYLTNWSTIVVTFVGGLNKKKMRHKTWLDCEQEISSGSVNSAIKMIMIIDLSHNNSLSLINFIHVLLINRNISYNCVLCNKKLWNLAECSRRYFPN